MNPEILQKVLESDIVAGSEKEIPQFTGLSIDSRTIKAGDIFFAIVGDKNDGHDYIEKVFAQGAAAAIISRSQLDRFTTASPGPLYVVDDTHEALLNLAGYIRRRADAGFAAITGSNGKTTTKEMLYSIVKVRHNVFRSPGNLNNLFGLPISLGRMPAVDYAIFELGISVPGEMIRLSSIIKPELAVITNIGPAHLETLITIDNVVKAKFELVDCLPVGAAVVLNADDPKLIEEAGRRNLDYIGFGIDNDCDFVGTNIVTHSEKGISFEVHGHRIELPTCGRVNVYNALAAIAASSIWGCGALDWQKGMADFHPVEMRLTMEHEGGLHYLVDCYNANPQSVKAALDCLSTFETKGRKIAVLGDMLELGEDSPALHEATGQDVVAAGVDFLLCLGPESKHVATGAADAGMAGDAICHFLSHQELLDHLLGMIVREDLILLKGSRGMELEKILYGLKGAAFKNN
ncbi:MAG: UDP-N-acetylmuramoyl-tripeptide--D-alanyl-D-alanine ligase [FCB group bacterium]|nr:UDP-N-acetylmuramoyl-tripeptide--D-alanyl-D-alanine ligase [FCB group bacterium]